MRGRAWRSCARRETDEGVCFEEFTEGPLALLRGAPAITLGLERSSASLFIQTGEKTEHTVERQIGR